jgi:hypothetical protein
MKKKLRVAQFFHFDEGTTNMILEEAAKSCVDPEEMLMQWLVLGRQIERCYREDLEMTINRQKMVKLRSK